MRNKIINIVSISVIIGFVLGISVFIDFIISNNYIEHKMHRLIAFNMQLNLNKWVVLSIGSGFIILIALLVKGAMEKMFHKKSDSPLTIQEKLRFFLTITVPLLFFMAAYYYFPDFFKSPGLSEDILKLFTAILLCWVLVRARKYEATKSLRKTALVLFLSLVILNLWIYVEGKRNIPKGPNVILIVIDTLRADHIGNYGHTRDTTPYIDKVSEKSIVFNRAFSQSSFTPPSLASILSSSYVTTHGLYRWGRLPDEIVTIAETLRNENYLTGAFVNLRLLSLHGLGQGFYTRKESLGPAENINRQSIEWLKNTVKNKKFFMFLHYYDVHRPFDPEPPFDKIFDSDYAGNITGSQKSLFDIWDNKIQLTARDVSHLDALYDSQIKKLDIDLNSFFTFLKNRGIYENSLIVITADHGEMMGHHPDNYYKYTHDPVLYNGVINIPLIIKYPFNKHGGKRFEHMVESIDIVPTIMNILDINKIDTIPLQGKNLNCIVEPACEFNSPRDFIFSETYGWEEKISIVKNYNKIIHNLKTNDMELYDLKMDPLELVNLTPENHELALDLQKELDLFVKTLKKPSVRKDKKEELSEEVKKELESLGYLR